MTIWYFVLSCFDGQLPQPHTNGHILVHFVIIASVILSTQVQSWLGFFEICDDTMIEELDLMAASAGVVFPIERLWRNAGSEK